ncbi:tRNA threonylcarbamoyl adenosine modification protein YeaZ [Labedella gwakjiensis]|uniref:tRNA (Adenosine(37)-N6)-threonylcarbamoyltransferase complex dimerization subunit type 1 TsaB n=1 Tax=Labedella gwakjiensis TaxID=390269 RepID=A0A2P8GRX7_9MICO|nr:tRNA (adenosine(37)-N6)-threonylcarbamoyltransferase complex dimerization subunit type 1 TsaB [Labedella gwakjiensis]PSL36704.1 tRNA threonylcarbamoyl adenosine modification protein YeaZ [Labedella gwakjiensis]RUQ84220.1 tRNA (adenosine(37)-N6)-threonylcarbamoyltransferase complex dimerization subunit type 1 TsaB [Labedella gwakjiensis]
MILAIDSSIGTSVALADGDGRLLATAGETDHLSHAEVIGTLIRRVLDEADAAPADVSAVASGMGPGPFTGLRIGIAAARAFAVARGLPVIPVVSHDAVAAEFLESGVSRDLVVVTDARRREVAWSRYAAASGSRAPVRAVGPLLAARESFTVEDADRVDAVEVSAAHIALLAAMTLSGERASDADEPVYLRAPDVTLSTRKKVSQ